MHSLCHTVLVKISCNEIFCAQFHPLKLSRMISIPESRYKLIQKALKTNTGEISNLQEKMETNTNARHRLKYGFLCGLAE